MSQLQASLAYATIIHTETIEQKIERIFPENYGTILTIAKCESNLRQFSDDGTVLTSSTKDFGTMQINERWLPVAESFGMDIKNNVDDNILFSKYLINKQGLGAYSASRKCWTGS